MLPEHSLEVAHGDLDTGLGLSRDTFENRMLEQR